MQEWAHCHTLIYPLKTQTSAQTVKIHRENLLNGLTLSSEGQRYKCWNVAIIFLLKRGAKTSFSVPNWCRDCLTMESMTYKPGTLYSGLHCWYRNEKTGVGILISGERARVHERRQTRDWLAENQPLDGPNRTHLLYELLHTLDNVLVELKDKEGNENIFWATCMNLFYSANKCISSTNINHKELLVINVWGKTELSLLTVPLNCVFIIRFISMELFFSPVWFQNIPPPPPDDWQ